MNEDTGSIFDPPPPPEHMVAEARMLAVAIYEHIRLRLRGREGRQPFDPSHKYGWHNMSKPWWECRDKELWIEAIIEYMRKRAKGMF
jgi:hypothetical protein